MPVRTLPRCGPARRPVLAVLLLAGLAACASTPPNTTPGVSASGGRGTENLMALAEATLAGGDERAAIELFGRAIAVDPTAPGPRLALAAAYFQIGALTEARVAYAAVAAQAPVAAGLGLGRVALAGTDGAVAGGHFAAVLAVEPDNVEALNGAGVAYDLTGRHGEAQRAYARALVLDPTNRGVANNQALSLMLGGNRAQAIAQFERLAGDALRLPQARYNLALAYGLAGDDEAARRLLATDLAPDAVDQNLAFYRAAREVAPAAGG